jgi:hypothetical protein
VKTERETTYQNIYITPQLLERWFTKQLSPMSYGEHLHQQLPQPEVDAVRSLLTDHLLYQTLTWRSAILYITAEIV